MAAILELGLNVDSAPVVALRQRLDEVKASLQSATDPALITKMVGEIKTLTSTVETLNDSLTETGKDAKFAANSIGALKQKQSELNKELEKVEIGSDAYKDLSTQLAATNKELSDVAESQKEFSNLGNDVKLVAGSIGELEAKQQELNESIRNVQVGSEEYEKLRQQLIATNTELRNIELSNEALDNEQLAGELKSVAGGFADMAGGLALVGVSSGSVEQIAQTFAKVEGITKAVTGGIEAYSSGMKVLNALTARGATISSVFAAITGTKAAAEAVDTAALGAQTVATEGAEVATAALNATMLLNPVFLIIAGIAALVGALYLFSSSTEVAEEQNNALNKVMEEQLDLIARSNEANERNAQNVLDLAKARGASEEEIHYKELNLLKVREDSRKRNVNAEKVILDLKKQVYKKALEEGNEDLAKEIADEIKQHRQKYKDLKALDGQYQTDKKILNAQYNTDQKSKQKQESEAEKKEAEQKQKEAIAAGKRANEEKKKKQEEYAKNRFDALRQQQDLELSLMEEGEKKEEKANTIKYERLIEDTKTNEKLIGDAIKDESGKVIGYTGEKGKRLNALLEQQKIDADKITKKYDDKELADKKAFDALLFEVTSTDQQKVFADIDAKAKEKQDKLIAGASEEIKATQAFQDTLIAIQKKADADKLAITNQAAADKKKIEDDARMESLNKALADAKDSGVGIMAAQQAVWDEQMQRELEVVGLTEEQKKAIQDKYRKMNEEANIAAAQKIVASIQEGLNMLSGAVTAFQDVNSQKAKQATDAANEQVTSAQEAFDKANEEGSKASEEEKARLQENLVAAQKNAEGKAAAEEKLAKKQFEINKKLQIAQAIIQGVQAVLAAYSSGSAIPVVGAVTGPLFAALAAATVVANVAKIKNSKFESTSASPSTGAGGASASAAVTPAFNLFGNSNNSNNATGQNSAEANKTQNINVTVGVDEITNTQNNVQQITAAGKL